MVVLNFGSFDLTVNGTTYFLSGIELVLGGTVVLGTGKGLYSVY